MVTFQPRSVRVSSSRCTSAGAIALCSALRGSAGPGRRSPASGRSPSGRAPRCRRRAIGCGCRPASAGGSASMSKSASIQRWCDGLARGSSSPSMWRTVEWAPPQPTSHGVRDPLGAAGPGDLTGDAVVVRREAGQLGARAPRVTPSSLEAVSRIRSVALWGTSTHAGALVGVPRGSSTSIACARAQAQHHAVQHRVLGREPLGRQDRPERLQRPLPHHERLREVGRARRSCRRSAPGCRGGRASAPPSAPPARRPPPAPSKLRNQPRAILRGCVFGRRTARRVSRRATTWQHHGMDFLNWDEKPADLRDPVMIAAFGGWNDAAAAASGAVVYIGEQFGARRVASIDPEEFYDFQATRPLIDLSSPEALVDHVARGRAAGGARRPTAPTTCCWWPAPSRRCAGRPSRACCWTPPSRSA